jgi:hypothetical protein
MSISAEGELTEDQTEKVTVGGRIKLGAVTGLSTNLERSFVAIQWDEKDLPELYTRAAIGRPVFRWARAAITTYGHARVSTDEQRLTPRWSR